jgi:hypothetical protein
MPKRKSTKRREAEVQETVAATDGPETVVDERPALERSGPRVEIHRDNDDSLHTVVRCPVRPTEITSTLAFPTLESFVQQTHEWVSRHALLANCDCADFTEEALRTALNSNVVQEEAR